MKKFLAAAAAVILALAFTACGEDAGEPQVTLTIQNQTFSEIIDVVWNNVEFGAIAVGRYATRLVNPGTGFINFERLEHSLLARTTNHVSVGGSNVTFVFMDNTEISGTAPANLGNTGRFDTLLVGLRVGDTGPGGGIVFSAQSGQYMEASNMLGFENWADANFAARNYNGGGFDNWTLPTRAQLNLIFQHNAIINLLIIDQNYWSSEMASYGAYWALSLDFETSFWQQFDGNTPANFFAVRSFSQ